MAVLACTALVAVVTFALSFAGLRDYGLNVAGVPWQLAWLVPIGIDGLTVASIAATFALRQEPWHVRLYAWLVFFAALAASVAGNLSHAVHRNLSWDGAAGAGAWPALLALASHLVVVTWRRVERQAPIRPAAKPGAVTGTTEPKPTRQAKPKPVTDKPDPVVALLTAGKTQPEIAEQTGLSVRTVARRAKALRKSSPDPAAAPAT